MMVKLVIVIYGLSSHVMLSTVTSMRLNKSCLSAMCEPVINLQVALSVSDEFLPAHPEDARL